MKLEKKKQQSDHSNYEKVKAPHGSNAYKPLFVTALSALLLTCLSITATGANTNVLIDSLGTVGDFDDGVAAANTAPSSSNIWWSFGSPAFNFTESYPGRPSGASDKHTGGDDRTCYAITTGHTIASGDTFNLSFYWTTRDADKWEFLEDRIELYLYYTSDNTASNTILDEIVVDSGLDTNNAEVFQGMSTNGLSFSNENGAGKTLYVGVRGGSTVTQNDYWDLDNVGVECVTIPPDGSVFSFQ